MKLKSKVLFLIGLILLLCSSNVFALSLKPSLTGSYDINFNSDSGVDVDQQTAGIYLDVTPMSGEDGGYTITATGDVNVRFQGTSALDSQPWGTSLQPINTSGFLFIQLTSGGAIAGGDEKVTITNSGDGATGQVELTLQSTAFTTAQQDKYVSNLPNLNASNAGSSVSITPADPAGQVVYGYSAAIDPVAGVDGPGTNYIDNVGQLNQSTRKPGYVGSLQLTSFADIRQMTAEEDNTYVCATEEQTDDGVIQAYWVTPIPLNITQCIAGLSFQPTSGETDFNGTTPEPYTYYPGGDPDEYAGLGKEIRIVNTSATDAPEPTYVLNGTGDIADTDNCLVVECTPPLGWDGDQSSNTNNFVYGSIPQTTQESLEIDKLNWNLQSMVKFSSDNSAVASVSNAANIASSVDFGTTPGQAKITASASGKNQPEINSTSQGDYYNQYVLIDITGSVVNITGFTSVDSLTYFNYPDYQGQALNIDLAPVPENAELPSLEDISFTITKDDDSTVTANYKSGIYAGPAASLSSFTFTQPDPVINSGQPTPDDGEDYQAGNPIYLEYSGSGALPGDYTVTVSYENQDDELVTETFAITVVDETETPEVYVTYNNVALTADNPQSVNINNLTNGQIQLGYLAEGIDPVESVEFSIVSVKSNTEGTKPNPIINPQTGLLDLSSGAYDVGDVIEIQVTVNGSQMGLNNYGITSVSGYITIAAEYAGGSGIFARQNPYTVYAGFYLVEDGSTLDLNKNVFNMNREENSDSLPYIMTITPNPETIDEIVWEPDDDPNTMQFKVANYNRQFTVTVQNPYNLKDQTSFVLNVIGTEVPSTSMSVAPVLNLNSNTLQSENINAQILPQNNTDVAAPSSGSPTYSCENTNVAVVDGSGRVTGIRPGTTYVITTWIVNGKTYTGKTLINVDQTSITSINIAPSTLTLNLQSEQTGTLTANVNPASYVSQIQWSSSNPAVATITPSADNPAVVTINPVSVGTATITAQAGGMTASSTVTVVDEEATSLTVSPEAMNLSIAEGATSSMTATATVEPASLAEAVSWTSEDPSIATVSPSNGSSVTVTGMAVGTTTITATCGGLTDTIAVTVTDENTPTSVEITPDPVFLTTLTGTNYINSQALTITPTPAGTSLSGVTLTSTVPTVATVAQGEDGSWTVKAVSEGEADINAVVTGTNTVLGTATVFVNDDQVICTSLVATPSIPGNPDYYDVTATGVQGNPAMGLQNAQIEKVSIFNWSTANQSDMNAKIAENMGSGVYGYDNFPVNNTNENFLIADQIYIHVYGKIVGQAGDGNYLGDANRSWMDDIPATAGNMAYIGYSQNVGFDPSSQFTTDAVPTTFIGSTGNNRQMEGLRISSNIPGVEVQTSVHVQDLDWQPYVADGTYAGTMHRNLQIEAMRLQLTGPNAPNYTIQYRVHQQDISWSAWTSDGQIAGVTGQGLQMEAAQVRIVPVGTALPQ